MNGDFLG